MSTFRRIMLSRRLDIDIDIDSLPETQKIYYTATSRVRPSENSLGVVIANKWNSSTKEGIIACQNTIEEIGNYAFQDCKNLTNITIPDSVTSIGINAFNSCSSLTSITIPDSVTSIGSSAFAGCTGELIINSKIVETNYTYYDYPSRYGWLSGAKFTKLTLGNNINFIGTHVFYGWESLTSVTIPASVRSIRSSTFDQCRYLKSIYISDIASWCNISLDNSTGPLTRGSNIYLNNELLTDLIIPNSVTTIRNYAFYGCASIKSVTIGDSVTSIGKSAFYGCSSLTSVTIGNGVTSIGEYAFYGCSSLKSITIGNSVTTIGDLAFTDCTSLKSIIIPESVTKIGHNAFSGCSSLKSITIPESVTSIGSMAFENCSNLASITIPNSVTTLGEAAFYECSGLTSATIGGGVKTLGEETFYGCNNLTSVIIGNSVTTIGERAFQACLKLKNITIPNNVTTIGNEAFFACQSLTSVYCKATTPPTLGGTGVFDYNGNGRKIYVSSGSVNAYKSAANWSEYTNAIIGYDFE